jgi:hypothetical protein
MTIPPLRALKLDTEWTQLSDDGRDVRLRFHQKGNAIEFSARRCAEGRLRDAYPVSAHDVELNVSTRVAPQGITRPLAALTQTILNSDHSCRRVVFAAASDDAATVSAVEAAGFRCVLDVDVPGAELSLLVAEPSWILELDDDRIPDS